MTVKETITTIGKPVPRQKSQNGSAGTTLMPVEFRGIDLHQLRAIKANVERRCGEGKWTDWISGKETSSLPRKLTFMMSTNTSPNNPNPRLLKPFHPLPERNLHSSLSAKLGAKPSFKSWTVLSKWTRTSRETGMIVKIRKEVA